MSYSMHHLKETAEILVRINADQCKQHVRELADVRARGGRLLTLGGSAENASHARNDFRKIAGFEAYVPTDNVSELTARTNDEGRASVFAKWLRGSRLNRRDTILILSVGGGNLDNNVSPNLVAALLPPLVEEASGDRLRPAALRRDRRLCDEKRYNNIKTMKKLALRT